MRHRLLATVPAALLLAACGQSQQPSQDQDLKTFDVQQAPEPPPPASAPAARYEAQDVTDSAPSIAVTAAPGVAFDYRYAFRLPTPRIGAVQEAHAAMCEKLGIDRCRIIGMRYQLRGSDSISAMLALRLDPAIARQFGKDATKLVTGAEGMLVDQEITGIDVGSKIDNATRSKARLRNDLDRIEAELKATSAKDPRRGDLAASADDLRRQIASLSSGQDGDREALAGTPMVFNYGSGNVIPGFDQGSPIGDAFGDAGRTLQHVVAMLIVFLAGLLPFVVLGWIALMLWRRFGGRLPHRAPADPPID